MSFTTGLFKLVTPPATIFVKVKCFKACLEERYNLCYNFTNSNFYYDNKWKEISGKEINEASKNAIFYKILDDDLIHYDFEYKQGLNTDVHYFNPEGTCKQGGLYFTDEHNIPNYINYGDKIARVFIPDDARCYFEGKKLKCDKIILDLIKSFENHEIFNDVDICMRTIKEDPAQIQNMSTDMLKNNIELCIEAVKLNGYAIIYIDEEILFDNIYIYKEAIK